MTNKDFFLALDELEETKGIKKEVFIDALEQALVFAYKKHTGDASGIEVKLDPEKGSIRIFSVKNVVDEVADPEKEISVAEAQEIKKSYKAGDVISAEIKPREFGRIAAQTAKQVVMQKLREVERDNTLSEFSDREDELMTCVVRRIEDRNVYVEIGKGQIEGVLQPSDQVPGERYELNQTLKVYVRRVRNMGRNAQILVSRSSAGLVKRLFENEVPEIRQGLVQVKAISREAGARTKIAIYSEDADIDAVGACVGPKGSRVNAVVAELSGEKIDIILWSPDPLEFIAKALSPAKVLKVVSLAQEKSARVIVPDDKLSLAIGRDGQNARLAARLTGWKIDVKSESAAAELEARERAAELAAAAETAEAENAPEAEVSAEEEDFPDALPVIEGLEDEEA